MNAIMAFLHHFSAFCIMSILFVELVLCKQTLNYTLAKKIARFDLLYGIFAILLLTFGLARVFYFEKGWHFYSHSIPFHIKMMLFCVMGLLSIIPTKEFLSWRKYLAKEEVPPINPERMKKIRLMIHTELTLMIGMMLCAALMAKGIGTITP